MALLERGMYMNNTLGGRILELLKKNGLTQRELANKVNVTDVSMSRYIKGERIPRGPIVANIAKALNTTSDYLLGQETEKGDSELQYYQVQRLIARNAKDWSLKQKQDLISVLVQG